MRKGASITIDADKKVVNLRAAIKAGFPNRLKNIDAPELQLHLGKKHNGDGPWVTENDVKKGVSRTAGLTLLDSERATLRRVGLDVGLDEVSEEVAATGNGPVHVLVAVPQDTGGVLGTISTKKRKELAEIGESITLSSRIAREVEVG
ncbi:hypothetical protein P3T76_014126 [Phytophthora citrophthora]|uniref:Crinkler effector protein N-terminal domain-containing protein n=1 Tax=Phytophthora citrophthora TaxID=4793 RepID=A0AAD9LBJ6_9STRA|nr:hypothetical protein P3T76_014126 [Phytophthora citrophthora]